MDAFRHINNVQIARLFEEARVRTFDAWFPGPRPDGIGMVVARHEIEYTAVLHYSPEPVHCEVWVTRIGGKSFDLGCRLLSADGAVASLCETTLTVIDVAAGRATAMNDDFRALLETHLGGPVPFRHRG